MTAQFPGRCNSATMNGSFQSVGVAKSPPMDFSLGLLKTGNSSCPWMRVTSGRSLLISSAPVDSSSIARKIHSDQNPRRLRSKRTQARWNGDREGADAPWPDGALIC